MVCRERGILDVTRRGVGRSAMDGKRGVSGVEAVVGFIKMRFGVGLDNWEWD